jgi:hypothetical protein
MDLLSLALGLGFFAVSWGLTHFCDRLQRNGRNGS